MSNVYTTQVAVAPEWATQTQPICLTRGADVTFVAGGADPAHPHGGNRKWIRCDQDKGAPAAVVQIGARQGLDRQGDGTARWARVYAHLVEFSAATDAQTLIGRPEPALGSNEVNLRWYYNSDRTITLVVEQVGDQTDTFTSDEVVATGTPYWLEVWYIFRDSDGNFLTNTQVVVRLVSNLGAAPITTTFINANTSVGGAVAMPSALCDYIEFGENTDQSYVLYVSNVFTGVVDADDPTKVVRTVRGTPNADGTHGDWDIGGTAPPANDFQCVDEDPGAVETDDYLYTNQNNEKFSCDMPDSLVGGSDNVFFGAYYARWMKGAAAKAVGIFALICDGAADSTYGYWATSDTNWHDQGADAGYPLPFDLAPGGGAWTPGEVDSCEVGAATTTLAGATQVRVTMCFLIFAYEADGDGDLPVIPDPVTAAERVTGYYY